MKYLSIYADSCECVDFLKKYDFLPTDFDYDDDLLRMFEGDPDVLYLEGSSEPVFFSEFHPDYEWDGDQVVLTTAELQDEEDAIKSFFERTGEWLRKTCEEFKESKRTRIKYRGGRGYFYSLFELA